MGAGERYDCAAHHMQYVAKLDCSGTNGVFVLRCLLRNVAAYCTCSSK